MAQTTIPPDMLKQAMKEALAEAIEEGRQSEKVDREQIFDVLEGRA